MATARVATTALALLTSAVCGLGGCTALYISGEKLAARNQRALQKIEPGMTRAEVDLAFGTYTLRMREGSDPFRFSVDHPYRTLDLGGLGPLHVEVLYYYTTLRAPDGYVGEDELTPVVMRGGEVVGWGEDVVRRECDPDAFEAAMGESILAEMRAEGRDRPGGPDPLESDFRNAVGRANFLIYLGNVPSF